jgi:hypothetical protein
MDIKGGNATSAPAGKAVPEKRSDCRNHVLGCRARRNGAGADSNAQLVPPNKAQPLVIDLSPEPLPISLVSAVTCDFDLA